MSMIASPTTTSSVNKLGILAYLVDEPRPVLSMQLTQPDNPIGVTLAQYTKGGRCWK